MRWRKVTLIGVGLLGGSLGLALKARALAQNVTGYVRREQAGKEALNAGAVDEGMTDLQAAVKGADLIVLCTPLLQMRPLAEALLPAIEHDAIVTDVGSVKATLVEELEPLFSKGRGRFIGSHPMAGSEKMGVGAARADLFEKAICVITPSTRSDEHALAGVEELWTNIGARTLRMTPEEHDQVVARSSHLPHVLAAQLASYVLAPEYPAEQKKLCAGGFRDSTRIAAGSPGMWRDILSMNRQNISTVLKEFRERLRQFEDCLERNDLTAFEDFLKNAKERRDTWAAQHVPKSPE